MPNHAQFYESKPEKVEEKNHETLLMTHLNSVDCCDEEIWFLDSGCSNHMSGNKSLFLNLDESVKSEVKLGDDHLVKVDGKENVLVKIKDEIKLLKDVLLVQASLIIY